MRLTGFPGDLVLPPRPPWQTIDVSTLLPQVVGPFLRWLDLTQPACVPRPDTGDLGVRLMRGENGAVSCSRAEGMIPRLVHGIWLGEPLTETDAFRQNLTDTVRECSGQVEFVLWTDISRAEVLNALAAPEARPGSRPDRICSMLTWARENAVLVVDLAEVLHDRTDTVLWPRIAAERAKRTRHGYAVASAHLAVELVTLLGGAYVPGCRRPTGPQTLVELFDRVAASVPAFAGEAISDVLLAPAGHPALRRWREQIGATG